MAAHYDTYDYLSYWLGRGYEHKSEVAAIKEFLNKIQKIKTVLEVGAGFGRLVDAYSFRAKRVIITDPSSKLLKIARDRFGDRKKYKIFQASLENLPEKIRSGTIDLVVMIRVLHHLTDQAESIRTVSKLIRKNGYFILEYPNKRNWKAVFKAFLQGNFTFPLDIFPKDLRSKKSILKKTLPFFNFHPDKIEDILAKNGFTIIEKRSVSNLRSGPLKKFLSTDWLIALEKILQKPFAYLQFGPSIFILARKRAI